MTTYPQNQYFSGVVPGVLKSFDVIDCLGFSSVSVMCFSNVNFRVDWQWSMDKGINVDLIDDSGVVTAGSTYSKSHRIKSRYLYIDYNDTGAVSGSTIRYQLSLNTEPQSIHSLESLGVGVEIYDSNDNGVRSVISSDGSVGVALSVGGKEIDITSAGGSGSLVYFDGSIITNDTILINAPFLFIQNELSGLTYDGTTGKVTFTTAGTYLISFGCRPSQDERMGISINGAAPLTRHRVRLKQSQYDDMTVIMTVAAADYIQVISVEGTLNLSVSGAIGANMAIYRAG